MPSGVLFFAEVQDNQPKKSALEMARAGRQLAEALGGPFSGVVVGHEVGGVVAALERRGVPRIYVADDPALARPTADGFSLALLAAVEREDPEVVLIAASARGRDIAPALAARMNCGIISDATSFAMEQGKLNAVRPVYAGKAQVTVVPAGFPVVLSIRPNTFEPAEEREAKAEIVAIHPDIAGGQIRAVVTELLAPDVRTVDLTEADVIVSGGRGMKGPEHFHLIEELAAALGGVVGASRAVVDAGWRPHSEQVGQTGKTVSPKLYVACGISGAIQHLAGMSSSRCIVAINKDPEAPIFKVADYGIVGDVFDILPRLTAEVKARKG